MKIIFGIRILNNFFYINENISTMVNDWSMIEKNI